jgi:acyl-CoA-binding protein
MRRNEAFNLAAAAISDAESPLNLDRLQLEMRHSLSLYALYQQATKGDLVDENGVSKTGSDVDVPRKPGFLDLRGKAQWAAWQQVQGLSRREAQVSLNNQNIVSVYEC